MKKSRGSLFSNTYDILEDKQIFIVYCKKEQVKKNRYHSNLNPYALKLTLKKSAVNSAPSYSALSF